MPKRNDYSTFVPTKKGKKRLKKQRKEQFYCSINGGPWALLDWTTTTPDAEKPSMPHYKLGPGQQNLVDDLYTLEKFALDCINRCPESRQKSLAITNLEQAIMWAVRSVALHGEVAGYFKPIGPQMTEAEIAERFRTASMNIPQTPKDVEKFTSGSFGAARNSPPDGDKFHLFQCVNDDDVYCTVCGHTRFHDIHNKKD